MHVAKKFVVYLCVSFTSSQDADSEDAAVPNETIIDLEATKCDVMATTCCDGTVLMRDSTTCEYAITCPDIDTNSNECGSSKFKVCDDDQVLHRNAACAYPACGAKLSSLPSSQGCDPNSHSNPETGKRCGVTQTCDDGTVVYPHGETCGTDAFGS